MSHTAEELRATDRWAVEVDGPMLRRFIWLLNRNLILDACGRRLTFFTDYEDTTREVIISMSANDFGRER